MQTRFTPPRRQSGAALALSLMMMAVLTIIGVVSMNATLLEMLMAGNTQFQTRALVNAENTLANAEQAAKAMASGVTDYGINGMRNLAEDVSNDDVQDPLEMDWDSTDSLADGTTDNRFLLEHAGSQPPDGDSGAWGVAAVTAEVIRVTAHAEGTKGATRIVQSFFVNIE